jgi:hypothetical protein
MMHVFAGLVVWTLYGYLGHRFWHVLMARGIHWRIYRKEELHHAHYDPPPHPDERYESWPIDVWMMTLALTVGYGFAVGLRGGCLFGLGAFAGMFVDDQIHRLHHSGLLHWEWFDRRHTLHHERHDCNFSFVTGALWDRILGTQR